MHKIIITLAAIMMFTTACGTNNTPNQNITNSDVIVQTSTPQPEQLETEQDQQQSEQQQDAVTEKQEDKWSSLPEYKTVIDNIATAEYAIETLTDNEGKRVLLWSNEANTEQYKTIYVKNTDRLKIISVDGSKDGLLYNDVIN